MRSMIAALLLASCTTAPLVRSGAGEDGTFAMVGDVDPHLEARLALERDARRREARMLDAIDPGRVLALTRLSDEELGAGLVPASELFAIGGELFHHTFLPSEGGASVLSRFDGVSASARRCASCHQRGGAAGSGTSVDVAYLGGDGEHVSTSVQRRPPSLAGLAWLELVAREMSADLTTQRDATVALARARGADVTAELRSHDVSFGALTAHADGTLDASALAGIDADLVVRPFGARGVGARVEDLVTTELSARLGLHVGVDALSATQRTTIVAYLALLSPPVEEEPTDPTYVLAAAHGRDRFAALGCASCHVAELPVAQSLFEVGSGVRVDLGSDGEPPRLSVRPSDGVWIVRAYSDLRRHAMGAALADARSLDALASDVFVTTPLWGMAATGPYLHDARAGSVEDSIMAHGGEAQASRDAYAALTDADRGELRVFLATLTRARRLEVP